MIVIDRNVEHKQIIMKKPTKLPAIELIELVFSYDPHSGLLHKNGKPLNGTQSRTGGSLKVKVCGKCRSYARVCWALFHRKDPIHYRITHLDGNPRNNCIDNLRAVRL